MSALYSRLPQRIAQALGIRGTSAVFAFLLSYLLVRLASPERLGAFAIALLTSQLVAAVALVGMDSMMLRLIVRAAGRDNAKLSHRYQREAYALSVFMATFGTVVTALGGGLLLWLRADLREAGFALIRISPAVYFSCICQLASVVLRSRGQDARSQIIYVTLPSIVAALAILLASALGLNIARYVEYLYVLGALLSYLIARHWVPHSELAAFEEGKHLFASGRLRFIRISAPIQIANLANYVTDWAAMMMLSFVAPLSAVAVLRVLNQLGSVFLLISTGFEIPLSTAISMAHQRGDRERLSRLTRRAREWMLLATSPMIVILFVFPGLVLSIFKVGGQSAELALRILLGAHLIKLWTGASASALNVLNGTRELIKASLLSLVLSLLLVSSLIPLFGLIGAAVSAALALAARSLLNYYYFNQVVKRSRRAMIA